MEFSKILSPATRLAIVTVLYITVCSCVSVKIGPGEIQKSEDMKFSAPGSSFVEIKTADVDSAWRNPKNGNTISFLSDCRNPTDPSLENIFKGITSEIEEVAVIESNRVVFNSRDALHSTVEGKVDGVHTRFELMIFKKNSCTYVLTYAATAKSFAANQREFGKFVKEFYVP